MTAAIFESRIIRTVVDKLRFHQQRDNLRKGAPLSSIRSSKLRHYYPNKSDSAGMKSELAGIARVSHLGMPNTPEYVRVSCKIHQCSSLVAHYSFRRVDWRRFPAFIGQYHENSTIQTLDDEAGEGNSADGGAAIPESVFARTR